MRVSVRHETRIDYSAPVTEEVLETRLGPFSDAEQRCERFELRVRPSGMLRPYVDGFGNNGYIVTVPGSHDYIEITTDSVVTTIEGGALAPHPVRALTPLQRHDFLSPSSLVPRDSAVNRLAGPFRPTTPDDFFEATERLSGRIRALLDYRLGVTDTATTAVEALRRGSGVCQDFAHLLIACCRAVDIPARYVSGYLLQDEPAAADAASNSWTQLSSAGASHAWVEVLSPRQGWKGFDPTHHTVAGERYVKMAIGRDYADVPPTKGVFRGDAQSTLTVGVATHPVE
jgi:transglutaminase-like putative cysteine protease